MKVIDNSAADEKSGTSGPLGGVMNTFKLGRVWSQDMQAQEGIITALERLLDNRYTLLRNVSLEGLDIPIPLVLVGPPGVRVLYPSASRGVYRAKDDVWEKMEDDQKGYKSVLPNLLTRTQLMGRAVESFLTAKGYPQTEVEPVLVFSDPGIHVDTIRPVVRVVMVDALERFIAGLVQIRTFLNKDEIEKIVALFAEPKAEENASEPPPFERDAFSFSDEDNTRQQPISVLSNLPRGERAVSALNKIPFTTRQWVLLILMVLVNIILLVAFVIIILTLS
jgi:hypothetical protein